MILNYNVDNNSAGKLVKEILKRQLNLSSRLIKKLKYDNKITVNKIPVHVNHPLKDGDFVEVIIEFDEVNEDIVPEDIQIEVIYEDESIIVLNKQPGIIVHPTSLHANGTIANAVMFHLLKNNERIKIRPVSRLDRDTSGIIIFAKNAFIQDNLIRQMKDNTFKKQYIGVVHGVVSPASNTINLPIDRMPGSIMLRQISPDGAPSITHYEVIEYLKDATLLKFILETGRTHQIRVHCQAIGHSILGDGLYSSTSTALIKRQALHSQKVSFNHPLTNERLELYAKTPEDISSLINKLSEL